MATEKVTLATLKRGQTYKHFYNGEYTEFRRNVPKVVDDDLADDLEDLVDTINTEEKQTLEVEKFEIERGVSRAKLEEEEDNQVRTRTRIVRETVPVRKKPKKVRKVSAGFGKRKKSS